MFHSGGDNLCSKKIDQLNDLFKDLSLNVLKKHSSISDFKIIEYKNNFLIHGHWMTFIQFKTDFFKVIFKAYFFSEEMAQICAPTYRKNFKDIENTELFDFAKEYCNLFCGEMKWYIEQKGYDAEQSLPLQLRSFDDLYFLRKEFFESYEKYWSLNSKGNQIIHYLKYEIYNPKSIEDLEIDVNYQNKDKGVFEIL